MGFGWPPGLAALATLLVPLLIHLARRRPRRPVLVGTLRHLPASTAPRRGRSRITEPVLLAVRMLVLAALALCVARPFLSRALPSRPPRSLLVIPSGIPEESLRRLLPSADSLLAAGLELRELPMADLWSELAELDAALPAGSSVAVAAPDVLPMAGVRPVLQSTVSLHRFEAADDANPEFDSTRILRVRIIADSSHRIPAARHAAAFRAVAELRGDSLILAEDSRSEAFGADGWFVWLADSAPAPAMLEAVRAGGTLLTSGPGVSAGSNPQGLTVEKLGSGRVIASAVIGDPPVDATFPELIARIWPDPSALAPAEPELRRITTSQLLPARASPTDRAGAAPTDLDELLLALAAALFLVERWLSHRRLVQATP